MFKLCRENHCLNRLMIDFFTRQLTGIKQLSNRVEQLAPEMVADQLNQCVALMEKRIVYALQQKTTEPFHDYVADFYEDKLANLRRQISNEIQKNKRLEKKIEQLGFNVKQSEQAFLRSKSYDITAVNDNLSLKKELVHSQRLLADNQQMMQAQNQLINDMKGCILRAEERESQIRTKFQEKARELDAVVSAKKNKNTDLIKAYEQETKRMDRQFRQLELQNISLIQQKDALESQIILKTQEIKLLSKKIYDQNMLIGKYERELHLNQNLLQEEKIGINRAYDDNKMMKDKLKQIQGDFQRHKTAKTRQLKQLETKLAKLTNANKQMEELLARTNSNCDKFTSQLKVKKDQLHKKQTQCNQLQTSLRVLEKQNKRLERAMKENQLSMQEYQYKIQNSNEEIKRLRQQINRVKKDTEACTVSYEREKELIKHDLEGEFSNLVNLNKQMLKAVEKAQTENLNLRKQNEQLQAKNKNLSNTMQHLSESFEDAKKMMNSVQQEKHDLYYIREQLEIKLKHTERKCEELQKLCNQKDSDLKAKEQLQESNHTSKKLIRDKETQIEKYKKIINDQTLQRGSSQAEQIRILKEELCKKEFMIRQLNSKLNEVQAQLRDYAKRYQQEKESMTLQIREMQRIIQDNFDHSTNSNRLIDSGLA